MNIKAAAEQAADFIIETASYPPVVNYSVEITEKVTGLDSEGKSITEEEPRAIRIPILLAGQMLKRQRVGDQMQFSIEASPFYLKAAELVKNWLEHTDSPSVNVWAALCTIELQLVKARLNYSAASGFFATKDGPIQLPGTQPVSYTTCTKPIPKWIRDVPVEDSSIFQVDDLVIYTHQLQPRVGKVSAVRPGIVSIGMGVEVALEPGDAIAPLREVNPSEELIAMQETLLQTLIDAKLMTTDQYGMPQIANQTIARVINGLRDAVLPRKKQLTREELKELPKSSPQEVTRLLIDNLTELNTWLNMQFQGGLQFGAPQGVLLDD